MKILFEDIILKQQLRRSQRDYFVFVIVLFLNLELRLKNCLIQSEDSFQARRPIKIIPEDYFKRENCLRAEDVNNFFFVISNPKGENVRPEFYCFQDHNTRRQS